MFEVDFINDLRRVSWQNVVCFDDLNSAWQAWKSDFNVNLDHYAPIRHMRVRQSSVPYLSTGGLQGASCQKLGAGVGVLYGHLPLFRLANLSAK